MSCRFRIPLLMLCDAILINLAIIVPYIIRFEVNITRQHWTNLLELSVIATPVLLAIFYVSKIYHRVWAYASTDELITILQSTSLGMIATTFLAYMIDTRIPRSIFILSWAFTIILVGGSRFAWRLFIESRQHGKYPIFSRTT